MVFWHLPSIKTQLFIPPAQCANRDTQNNKKNIQGRKKIGSRAKEGVSS